MSEMVERVARVISAREWDMPAEHYDRCAEFVDAGAEHDGDCTHQCHTCQVCMIGEIRGIARAAIATLREPTKAMDDAGRDVLSFPWTPSELWRAMIDAALAARAKATD